MTSKTLPLSRLLGALRAAGEPTRLRLLAILARNELTVSELTRILGQSQPRVSRHLKLLCEAHLLERYQEGSWVCYRIADTGPAAHIARELIKLLPDENAEMLRDADRLEAIRDEHARKASVYFEKNAQVWDEIRRLYVTENDVEQAMLSTVADLTIEQFLDLGTGTGRVLEVFGASIQRGLGVDSSREMLAIARAKLEAAELSHCQVRHGDIYNLPVANASVDVVSIHQVLHFLDDPSAAVREAVRTLKPGGRLLIVDFAPHQIESLRVQHAHRRLGFADDEVSGWLERAGARTCVIHHLAAAEHSDKRLTVSLWVATPKQ